MRLIARFATVVCAAASVAFEFHVGSRNSSVFLMVLFTGWVLLPFVALLVADAVATRWTPRARSAFHWTMLAVALCSAAVYGAVALGPPRPKPAFFFLVVPLASGIVIAIVVPLAIAASRRRQS